MKHIPQKAMVFYKLYTSYKEDKERWVATWEFGGEMYIKELDKWVLMSYKCPTRLTDIYQDNPMLLERQFITGKSGAKYYQYRFAPGVNSSMIKDKELLKFYNLIKQ